MAQPRVFFTMARDGLLPQVFARVHPRFKTPYIPTILTGCVAAIVSGLFPINILGTGFIGTLLAFVIVCIGVLVLRYRHPEIPRVFRTPWVPLFHSRRSRDSAPDGISAVLIHGCACLSGWL